MAKSLCSYQPWGLLWCGNSFCCVVCVYLPCWRHGGPLRLCVCLSVCVVASCPLSKISKSLVNRGSGWESYVDFLYKSLHLLPSI